MTRVDEYGEPVGFISIAHKVEYYQRKVRDELQSLFPNVEIEFKNVFIDKDSKGKEKKLNIFARVWYDEDSLIKFQICNYLLTCCPDDIWDCINHEVAHWLSSREDYNLGGNHSSKVFQKYCKLLGCDYHAKGSYIGFYEFQSIKFKCVTYQ